ncbi:hypothetical protein KAR91_50740 [Candidatus Pacearchaeota archaeon]|nr:hypothetical protein [Candidatus Pacearchaeota archaeon]
MNIDTTSQQYQNYLAGLTGLRQMLAPSLDMFAKLPRAEKKKWLQMDPLMRKVFKTGLIVAKYVEEFREDVEND